jgi:hypothetical protein
MGLMGVWETQLEEMAEDFIAGRESIIAGQIARDRYCAGSMAVGVALVLLERGGVDLVRKFYEALDAAEDSS